MATHHRKPPPCFAKTAGRENPTEPGRAGASAGPVHPAAVPMTLTAYPSSCPHDTHSVCEAAGQQGGSAVGGEMV